MYSWRSMRRSISNIWEWRLTPTSHRYKGEFNATERRALLAITSGGVWGAQLNQLKPWNAARVDAEAHYDVVSRQGLGSKCVRGTDFETSSGCVSPRRFVLDNLCLELKGKCHTTCNALSRDPRIHALIQQENYESIE